MDRVEQDRAGITGSFTGYRHCIDQLEDVFQYGAISLDHLGSRASAYSLLNGYYKSILDPFAENRTGEI